MNRLCIHTSRRLAAAAAPTASRGGAIARPSSPLSSISVCAPAVSLLPHQRQCRRTMASKKNRTKIPFGGLDLKSKMKEIRDARKEGGGGGGKKAATIKIRPVFGNFDLEYAPDDLFEETGRTLDDVKQALEGNGMATGDRLEVYDEESGEWKTLTDGELENFGGDGVMKVRNPAEFDDDFTDDLLEGVGQDFVPSGGGGPGGNDGSTKGMMRLAVSELVEVCKGEGYERAGNAKLKNDNGEIVSTKEWVLETANENRELLLLFVDNVGALDHVVECMHFDAVWDGKLSNEGGDSENEE